jgi:hypothetical protein
MTWTVVISLLLGILLKFLMCPPSAVGNWFISKFALHQKLHTRNVTVTFNGKALDGEGKIRLTESFNEAIFLQKHPIFPGNEHLFLKPETNITPIVITGKRGKHDVNIHVYRYDDHVHVVRQYKKKVVSYSLRSDYLQNFPKLVKVESTNII